MPHNFRENSGGFYACTNHDEGMVGKFCTDVKASYFRSLLIATKSRRPQQDSVLQFHTFDLT